MSGLGWTLYNDLPLPWWPSHQTYQATLFHEADTSWVGESNTKNQGTIWPKEHLCGMLWQSLWAAWPGPVCSLSRPALDFPLNSSPSSSEGSCAFAMTASCLNTHFPPRSQAFPYQLLVRTPALKPPRPAFCLQNTGEAGFIHIGDSVVPSCHL